MLRRTFWSPHFYVFFLYGIWKIVIFAYFLFPVAGNQTDILTKTPDDLTLNFGENDIIIIVEVI